MAPFRAERARAPGSALQPGALISGFLSAASSQT